MLQFTALLLSVSALLNVQDNPLVSYGSLATPRSVAQRQEVHRDWRVACVETGAATRCVLQQQLVDARSNRSVVALELDASDGQSGEGVIVMPLGLAVDQEASLDVTGQKRVLKIQTCVQVGCIARFPIDAQFMASLRTASSLTVHVVAAVDEGRPVVFSLSLDGFTEAFDRSRILSLRHTDSP